MLVTTYKCNTLYLAQKLKLTTDFSYIFLVIIFSYVDPSYFFLENFHFCYYKNNQICFWGSYFFDNHKYNTINFRNIIPKPNESQSKFAKTYSRVRWIKPREHPFRIPPLETCLGVATGPSDSDPMLPCSSG